MPDSSQRCLIFKVVAAGAGGVGKTTFFHRYTHNVFLANTLLTVGVNFHSKDLVLDEKMIKLFVWDLSGQPRFRYMHESYILGSTAGMVFFDISHPETITEVPSWVEEFRSRGQSSMPIILIGTKLDLATPESETIARNVALLAVEQLDLAFYMQTSSKANVNVSVVFARLIGLLLGKNIGFPAADRQEIQLSP